MSQWLEGYWLAWMYCMLYVLALKNLTWHCVASYPSYSVVYEEWVKLAIVSACHLVLWPSLLYSQWYIISPSSDKYTSYTSFWIKPSAKCTKYKCFVVLWHPSTGPPVKNPNVLCQAAKANLEKAQSEMAAASDETSKAAVQISIDANEAIVKALE